MATTSTQLGQDWTRVGNDVYNVANGQLGGKLDYQTFATQYKSRGLNLDIIPQWQAPTSSPTRISSLGGGAPLVGGQVQNPALDPQSVSNAFSLAANLPPPDNRQLTSSNINNNPQNTGPGFDQTFNKPGIFSPGEQNSTFSANLTTPYKNDFGSSSTSLDNTFRATPSENQFTRIGTAVYSLNPNGTIGKYVSANDFKNNKSLKGLNLDNVQQYNASNLSELQKTSINSDLVRNGQPAPFSGTTPSPEVSSISSQDFAGDSPAISPITTKGELDGYINGKITPIIYNNQPDKSSFTPPQSTNNNNGYYKKWNTATSNWDVFKTDGSHIKENDFISAGLNIDHINTQSSNETYGGGDTSDPTDPINLYSGTDSKLLTQANKIQEDLNELKTRDPFMGKTIDEIRKSLRGEIDLTTDYTNRRTVQDKIDNIVNAYEQVQGEITGSRNLTQSLKSRRGEYLTQQQLNILNPLTRNLNSINAAISEKEKIVTERLGDMVSQYNIYRNQVSDLQGSYDKLQGRIDKEADNIRQTMNLFMTNPELLKGMTQAEVNSINSNNGIIPMSVIERIGRNAGKDFQSFVSTNPTTNTVQYWGITKTGERFAVGGPLTDVKQTSGGGAAGVSSEFETIIDPASGLPVTYNIVRSKDTGQIISSTPFGAQAGATSASNQKQMFIQWLGMNKGTFSKSQLELAATHSGLKQDTEVSDMLEPFSSGAGAFKKQKDSSTSPVDSLNQFRGNIINTAGGNLIRIQDPNTGEVYKYSNPNDPEIQQAINSGWIKL